MLKTTHPLPLSRRKLKQLRQELPRLPLMALTATASERVQQDIVQQLRLRDPALLTMSFDRPEIAYEGEGRQTGLETPLGCACLHAVFLLAPSRLPSLPRSPLACITRLLFPTWQCATST